MNGGGRDVNGVRMHPAPPLLRRHDLGQDTAQDLLPRRKFLSGAWTGPTAQVRPCHGCGESGNVRKGRADPAIAATGSRAQGLPWHGEGRTEAKD